MCLYSRIIRNRKYIPNKKNGGFPPPVHDERVLYVPIGCQECIECRKRKSRDWQIRLQEEIKHNKSGKFITLTFSNESIKKLSDKTPGLSGYTLDNAIATKAMRLFLERWRKKYKKSLRHWMVTEIGHQGTENIHLHGIIWTDEPLQIVENIWQYGFVWKGKKQNGRLVNYVNGQTVNYIVKYIYKLDEKHRNFKSCILTSPGIGHHYTKTNNSIKNKYEGTRTNEAYRTTTGHKISLPIYYRNKIYSDRDRENLWIQKLNKEKRYILGQEIDTSKDLKQYFIELARARIINRKLGYGSGEKNWDQIEYEKQQRAIMMARRIQRIHPSGGGINTGYWMLGFAAQHKSRAAESARNTK